MSEGDESWLAQYVRHLGRISQLKQKMRDRRLSVAKAHCPKCGGDNTLILRLAPNKRTGGAIRWKCGNQFCGFEGME